jgi:transcriptional regulator with XRE-family HTH domain
MSPPRRSHAEISHLTSRSRRPEESAGALKIGTLARQLGISASLIRAWERLGLTSPRRTDSKYRLYTPEDVRILRRAVYLRRVQGLNAPAILNQLSQEGLLFSATKELPLNPPSIGPRLRKLRLARGVSLATVANAVNVSVGFLSNLERSQTGASISVLHRLAGYYDLNILDFHSAAGAAQPLVRPKDRKSLEGSEGVRMELLAWGKIIMEPHLFRVAPGSGSGESYSHQGEEFLFLTAGELLIQLEDT